MGKDYGRVEYSTRSRKWKAIGYKGRSDIKLGEYDTRDEAIDKLQEHVAEARKA